jgi:hypothetical protein
VLRSSNLESAGISFDEHEQLSAAVTELEVTRYDGRTPRRQPDRWQLES